MPEKNKTKINLAKLGGWLIKKIKYAYPLSIIIILIIIGVVLNFLYLNVYRTLSYAQTVTELSKQIPEQDVAQTKFNNIIEKIQKKQNSPLSDVDLLRNPFEEIIIMDNKN